MAPELRMPRSNRDPLVGTVVADRFFVKRALAAGAMGVVYVARDGGPKGPRVAMKVAAVEVDEVGVALMQRESRALARLDMPGVVGFVASGELPDGRPWIAMDLVPDAASLTTWARNAKVSGQHVLDVIRAVGAIVGRIHAAGVVHRDLKASNLLVSGPAGQPRVTVIDFGIAQLDGEADPQGNAPLLGGVHTSAPEQIRGDPVDARADQYSLGVLTYRLMVGRYPFHSKLPAEVLAGHLHKNIPDLPDDVPVPVAVAVRRALSKNPDDRYPDIATFVAALEGDEPAIEASELPWGWIVAGVLTVLAALYSVFALA